MKLISDILEDLVNNNLSLVVPLNKTKILASKIDNKELLTWVNNEIKGYPNNESAPVYRRSVGAIVGDCMTGTHHVTNYPLNLPKISDEIDKMLYEFVLLNDVVTIEQFSKNENPVLAFEYPDPVRRSIEDMMRSANGPYFQLISAKLTVPTSFATKVLMSIKDQLLDFMLALDKEFGVNTDITEFRRNDAKVNYIMNNTINTTGDGNIINTGDKSKITATITILKGNKDLLEETLRKNHVDEEDIAELLTVIDEQIPTEKTFGTKVNEWVHKMLAKSLDGSWQVGIGAAGTLLAEAIKGYYGF